VTVEKAANKAVALVSKAVANKVVASKPAEMKDNRPIVEADNLIASFL
jgi:hypothetical protein